MAAGKFRHGFKAEAERIAVELRGELGLQVRGRFVPEALAEHLAVPVRTLHDLRHLAPDDVAHLTGRGKKAFSAVTIYVGRSKRLIVTNPAHAPTRQMNTLCHELGHIILEHDAEEPPKPTGGRAWNGIQEREADWLAGCLLVPAEAAFDAARRGLSDSEVAEAFGVSRSLATWRMNSTAARIRATRLERFR